MARQLWLLRHGEAEPHDARPDAERRLTARGERQALAVGRAIARLELPVHLVFASPKARAWATAELACRALAVAPIEHRALADGFDADEALALASAGEADQRVLVVGHNPSFEQVVFDLTGARVELRKGALAGVRLDGGAGRLVALLQPRELARIAGDA